MDYTACPACGVRASCILGLTEAKPSATRAREGAWIDGRRVLIYGDPGEILPGARNGTCPRIGSGRPRRRRRRELITEKHAFPLTCARARSLARSLAYEEINNAPFTPGKKSGRARWIGFMACRCCINGRTRARAILRARVRAAIRPIAITSREEKETPNNG